ncbi:MAG: hypothetical protein ACE5IQ_01135 [Candidatus Methylomirabilales bacterium]
MTNEEREGRAGLGKTLRFVAIAVVVVIVAVVAGFGTGYFFREQKVQELQQRVAAQKEKMTAQISSLEKQVLEAQKSQLERALARAKLKAGLDEVIDSLTQASAEVGQRNFGRAMQKIEAAKGALTAMGGTTPAVREAIGAKLDEIKKGLERLDVKIQERITSLAKELEQGSPPGGASK